MDRRQNAKERRKDDKDKSNEAKAFMKGALELIAGIGMDQESNDRARIPKLTPFKGDGKGANPGYFEFIDECEAPFRAQKAPLESHSASA